jgi:hypothetical protein
MRLLQSARLTTSYKLFLAACTLLLCVFIRKTAIFQTRLCRYCSNMRWWHNYKLLLIDNQKPLYGQGQPSLGRKIVAKTLSTFSASSSLMGLQSPGWCMYGFHFNLWISCGLLQSSLLTTSYKLLFSAHTLLLCVFIWKTAIFQPCLCRYCSNMRWWHNYKLLLIDNQKPLYGQGQPSLGRKIVAKTLPTFGA